MEKVAILNVKICGFKCIDNPIEIQFTNKTINESIFDSARIKAIYGTNGVGKSAIVLAMEVYRKSIIDGKYLSLESRNGDLLQVINKKKKSAFIDVYFACALKGFKKCILHHYIEYAVDNDEIIIKKENLSYVKGDTWGSSDKESLIYCVENGGIVELSGFNKDLNTHIQDKSRNLLRYSSLVGIILDAVTDNEFEVYFEENRKQILRCFCLVVFVMSINVFIDERDSNKMSVQKFKTIMDEANKKIKNDITDEKLLHIDYETDEIDGKLLNEYKKHVEKRVFSFLHVFKPELKKIVVKETPVGDGKYRCRKELIYSNDNVVSSEYESNGIKKLMKLYPVLCSLDRGNIVFVDEFDSNIHDVYLCKLIEYFACFTKGQLLFTTHNLGPMEVLDGLKIKHSIDFINGSKITSWKKNGNYSVVKVYRSGSIPNCPFNLSSSDFIGVFRG